MITLSIWVLNMKLFGFADKAGSLGVIISAMGCAGCFPALGSLGAAIGLGFLAGYEGLFLNTLLSVFASIALLANLIGWSQHKVHVRGVISLMGPLAVLLTLYPLWQYSWSTYLFYAGLVLMFATSILDLVKPAKASQCQV